MKIYLARHGEYIAHGIEATGSLSDAGKKEIEQMAHFLRPLGIQVANMYHSGKLRAEQTAAILVTGLTCENAMIIHSQMNPEDDAVSFASDINQWTQDACLVGHLPFLARLVGKLLVNDENKELIIFHPGTVVCLEKIHYTKWCINWVLTRGLFHHHR